MNPSHEVANKIEMMETGAGTAIGTEIVTKTGTKTGTGTGTGVTAYVLHSCNSLSVQMADDFLKIPSVYFSFSGRALSANKECKLASRIPLDRILVETDSPDQLPLQDF